MQELDVIAYIYAEYTVKCLFFAYGNWTIFSILDVLTPKQYLYSFAKSVDFIYQRYI